MTMYGLFARDWFFTEGGFGDLVVLGTMEECLAASLRGADWAEIVNLQTCERVMQKHRSNPDECLTSVPWDAHPWRRYAWDWPLKGMPHTWRITLSPAESEKFDALGADAWLREMLEAAPQPAPAPVPGKAMRFLRSIEHADLPQEANDSAPEVSYLLDAGLVEGEVRLHEIPTFEAATVTAITPLGRQVLAGEWRPAEGGKVGYPW